MTQRVRVHIQGDGSSAVATVEAGPAGGASEIERALDEAGVIHGIDDSLCQRLAARLANPTFGAANVVVANEDMAESGHDEQIEVCIAVGTEAERSGTAVLHIPVTAAQVIARVHARRDAVPGMTVDGRRVEPGDAKSVDPMPKFGEGTALRPNGEVRATCAGVLVFRPGAVLEVFADYERRGHVNPRSGDIESRGSLRIVKGDVMRGAAVAAAKHVTVDGTINGGSVYTRGSLRVDGGIIGLETALVSVAGDVWVRHTESAAVECAGHLEVESDSLGSRLHAGSVKVGNRIVGGVVMAERSLVVQDVGSDTSTATVIMAGEPLDRPLDAEPRGFRLEDAKRLLEQRLAFDKRKGLSPEILEQMKRERVNRRHRLNGLRQSLTADASIEILGMAHPGVTICLGTERMTLKTQIFRARYSIDKATGRIRRQSVE
ncbi:MAG: FapA family protein [Nannocystaceae bacterium]